jgi:hypothetical protein
MQIASHPLASAAWMICCHTCSPVHDTQVQATPRSRGHSGDPLEDLLVERRGVLLPFLAGGSEGGQCARQHMKRRTHVHRHNLAAKRPG